MAGDRTHLRTYVSTCAAAAAAVFVLSLKIGSAPSLEAVLGFGVLSLLAESFAVKSPRGSTYSVTFVVTVAALVSIGPAGAIMATLFGAANLSDLRNKSFLKHVFNVSQLTISAGLAGLAFHAVGVSTSSMALAIPAALLAALLNFATNTGLVSGAIALSTDGRLLDVWREHYSGLGPAYAAYAVLGVLLAVMYSTIGWASLLFLLVPLLVARSAFQAAVALQGSFDQVITTMVAAVEQKDPYTSGHAARVAELTEKVAREYGLSPKKARSVRYAALMHDIGKLAVHNAVLQKNGKLTAEEYDHVRLHPLRGVEVVGGVELLEPVLEGIRHHHERYDGNGYPDGLAGEAIPLVARIITVCDAFDAMTSTRVYRKAMRLEDAFLELDRCSGTQFDPKAVIALRRTIAKTGWVASPEIRLPAPEPVTLDSPKPRRRIRSLVGLQVGA